MPEVTVILTSRNHGKFVGKAIESVLAQTFSNFELIVWDDASEDSSWDVINGFSDPRMRLFRNNKNRGVSYALNKSIFEESRTDLVAVHHSDDAWEKNKLGMQVDFLKKNPDIGAVFTNAQITDERGEKYRNESHPYMRAFVHPDRSRREWLNYFFFHGNALCHPSVLARKKCYADCGLYRPEMSQLQDFDMWIRFCLKFEIHVLPQKLVRFRLLDDEANSSGIRRDSVIRHGIECYNILKNYLVIDDFNELAEIFPSAEVYRRPEGCDPRFVLAMIALEGTAHPWINLFGLDLLYELFENPRAAGKIESIYGFGYRDLMECSGRFDVFSRGKLLEKEKEIAELRNSRSWRATRPLRRASGLARSLRSFRSADLLAAKRKASGLLKKIAGAYSRGGITEILRAVRRVMISRGNDYAKWIRQYDGVFEEGRSLMLGRIASFSKPPLISVIMPVYNPDPRWFSESVNSVRKQVYPRWELCIADDASTDEKTRDDISLYVREDSRVKAVFRERNGHISEASNSALEIASGEWAVLLDQDDLLAEDALYHVAEAIVQNPGAGIIYSDEDKINESGERVSPYFKSGWNRDLFYSHNLISHLGAYRMELLRDAGGFRKGFEGAQDYDLALRCIERLSEAQILHIPYVLYHWRVHAGSTAFSIDAKPYSVISAERALNEHLARMDIPARAEHAGPGYRVRYNLPEQPPKASLIILNRDSPEIFRKCVDSVLEKTDYPDFEILVVDNGSRDAAVLEYASSLERAGRIRLIRDSRPFNFSMLNNAAVKAARGGLLCLLNNDVEVLSADWLSEMASIAVQPGVGAVGARLFYPDGTLQHGGVILGVGGVAGHAHRLLPGHSSGYFGRAALINSFSAVTAACMTVRKSVYEEAGGLNETGLKVSFNDVDFCLRLREAGYRNVYTPYARLIHIESASRGGDYDRETRDERLKEAEYMKERWGSLLLNDPAYSPNLTLDYGNFSLAWPPRVPRRGHFYKHGAEII